MIMKNWSTYFYVNDNYYHFVKIIIIMPIIIIIVDSEMHF